MSLILQLSRLPSDTIGSYTIGGVSRRMPPRALFLYPDAAASFRLELAGWAVVSDIFRSPESSLAAMRSGRGAKPPGYSAHNFGLAIDLDVKASWQNWWSGNGGPVHKKELDEWLAALGWWCHRRDHRMTPLKGESHHYNWLGKAFFPSPRATSTAGAIEARILALYGHTFELDHDEAQTALVKLRLYHGDIDGLWGPLSREACRAFQRTWNLTVSGKLDARTQRTLAYVTAERDIVEP